MLVADPSGDRRVVVIVVNAATPNQYDELARTQGHAAADLFDRLAARSITHCLPAGTELYRLSAARFACVLRQASSGRFEQTLDDIARRIRHPEPGGHHIPFATSVGIGAACYPHDGSDAAELLRAAASGAHESLDGGRPWCRYDRESDRVARRAVDLLRDIGPALDGRGELRLVYQPKMELSTGRCIGAEALLRWTHPTLGPISPGEFVPLVERTTLVHAVTDWTLMAALPQVALWRGAGLAPQISINISMRDLRDDLFAARLAEMLSRQGVRPEWIDIEVTESALMKDPLRVGRQLDEVRRLGVSIEIDDYGSGQAGLLYLKYIPASYVKIDQAFVSKLADSRNDQVMVRSTIDLAHELGRRVVAEGVADMATLDWLCRHDCDIGQGNAISPPLEAAEFERALRLALPTPSPQQPL